MTNLHIGNSIREVMTQKNVSATELARRIYCTRTHVYKILAKEAIDIGLLQRISSALEHDFFGELSRSFNAD